MKILEFSFVLIILACGFLGMDCYQKNQEIARLNGLIDLDYIAMQNAEKQLASAAITCQKTAAELDKLYGGSDDN